MEINEYQNKVHETAVYPGQGTVRGLEYCLFGALGELGEIANKYKKILRKEENVYAHKEDLMEESGDVLWYMMEFLKELGYTAEQTAQFNIDKLAARKQSGTLKDRAGDENKDKGSIIWRCTDCGKDFPWPISSMTCSPNGVSECLRCNAKDGDIHEFRCINPVCPNK